MAEKKMYANVLVAYKESVLVLTLNRPDRLNALDRSTLGELHDAVTTALADPAVCGLVITGAGDNFAAGADIRELAGLDSLSGKAFSELGHGVFNLIENSDKPVLAAVDGYALGGGCELAMACHIRFASQTARFGQPEINLGLIPGFGGTRRLPRLVGKARALEMLLSGQTVSAGEALAMGLVNRVVAREELLSCALSFVETVVHKAPLSITALYQCVRASTGQGDEGWLDRETALFASLCATRDFKEGTSAFLEKRKPLFTGE